MYCNKSIEIVCLINADNSTGNSNRYTKAPVKTPTASDIYTTDLKTRITHPHTKIHVLILIRTIHPHLNRVSLCFASPLRPSYSIYLSVALKIATLKWFYSVNKNVWNDPIRLLESNIWNLAQIFITESDDCSEIIGLNRRNYGPFQIIKRLYFQHVLVGTFWNLNSERERKSKIVQKIQNIFKKHLLFIGRQL